MGKIRVAQTTGEDALQENEKQDELLTQTKAQKGKGKTRQFNRGNAYVRASYNNISISFTDENGNVLAWSTSGAAGFKGPRKATPYAATRVVELVTEKLGKLTFNEVHIFVNGIGSGRDAAIRALVGKGFNVTSLKDVTPVPHNGCRPPKPRHV